MKLIRNSNQVKQAIDFVGAEWKDIHPSDIDAVLEFDNEHLILFEVKRKGYSIPKGQRLLKTIQASEIENVDSGEYLAQIQVDPPEFGIGQYYDVWNITFTDVDDFPHNPLIVDTVYGFDSKIIKPFAYVIISQITHNIFVIPVSTKYDWSIQEYYDSQREITEQFYMVKKRHCRPFIELVDVLLERANERTNQM